MFRLLWNQRYPDKWKARLNVWVIVINHWGQIRPPNLADIVLSFRIMGCQKERRRSGVLTIIQFSLNLTKLSKYLYEGITGNLIGSFQKMKYNTEYNEQLTLLVVIYSANEAFFEKYFSRLLKCRIHFISNVCESFFSNVLSIFGFQAWNDNMLTRLHPPSL